MPKSFITLVFLMNVLDENGITLFILMKAHILGHMWKNSVYGGGR